MENKKGVFIVIEGIDGSGKSTLSKNLYQALQNKGMPSVLFSEPTTGQTGEHIRKFLKGEISLSREEILEAFLKDREYSVNNNILPNLQKGSYVILDRYFYSMAAYQADSQMTSEKILQMNLERNYPIPDKLFFLDIPVEYAFTRIQTRGNTKEKFESFSNLQIISENYKKILPNFAIVLNALWEPEKILGKVLSHIK